jgi:uncharacterized membrane protein YphA (DoxX/SURF4 family)
VPAVGLQCNHAKLKTINMEKIVSAVHWLAYAYYGYIFGYAGLFKIFKKKSMMTSMESLGFNETWTLVIGWAETLGVVGLIIGLFNPAVKNLSILCLFPFAVGAFTAHMAHNEYVHFHQSLWVCILTFVILLTDKHFKIVLA